MPLIAQRLTDADVRAMVAYYSALQPAPARERDVVTAWRPARAMSVVSGPKGSGSSAQGTGSEQGAGTTAGSQGPGGAGGTPQGNRSGSASPGN
ncbi:MAG: hypothetical protein JOZ58_22685 [Acetobacteraceae bacterium]|nr:hypothetical protein [Acetobacteraceae bacterium]